MKKVKLSKLVGERLIIEYPSQTFEGKITCDRVHGRPYYHLAFKSEEKNGNNVEDSVKTIFLEEENLKYHDGKLISKNEFCPIWTHRNYEAEYSEILNKN